MQVLIIAGLLGYMFPFFWMVSTSLKPKSEFYTYPPSLLPGHPSFGAFSSVLIGRGYITLLGNSIVICLSAVIFILALSLLIAYPLTRLSLPARVKTGILQWILSLRFLPPIVVVVPIFAIIRTAGLYDRPVSLIFLYSAFGLPFAVWMVKGFLQEVPKELEEAAWVDGASRSYAFFRILLPLLAPGILATAVISFALSWSEFLFALILTATPRAQTFPVGVWGLVTQFQIIWNEMAAVGVISVIVPVCLLLFGRRYVLSALTFGVIREKS
ncbi:MAG TPA: carbohydrate ABC transporter permease [Firmicutes bacterium]|nr:carbohydrate ABC transporter permease [Bacillota bacterium]